MATQQLTRMGSVGRSGVDECRQDIQGLSLGIGGGGYDGADYSGAGGRSSLEASW